MMIHLKNSSLRFFAACLCALSLSACDELGDESRLQKPLEGERIAVLSYQANLSADPELAATKLQIAPAQTLHDFPSQMHAQQRGVTNIAVSGFSHAQSARAGDGDGWESALIPAPVVAGGTLYAMDAGGTISAHDASDIQRVLWTSATRYDDDAKPMTGGGLAYDGGVLYATTASGSVVALVAKDGSLLWRQETNTPIRSAPAVADGQVYVSTIENQLLAFSARTGQPLWAHRGIRESAVYLGNADPTVHNGIVIAAYSSGELFALRAEDGSPLWSDSLIASKRTSASAVLTGISATPILRDNYVFAISNNGLMAASLLSTGRGLWDLELSSTHTPWLAGNYIFVLTNDGALVAVHRGNRRIRWISDSKDWYEDNSEGDTPRSFTAPMMVNGQLLLISPEGEMLFISPEDGTLQSKSRAPSGVYTRPIVAGGKMYLIDQGAQLHVME